MMNKLLTYQLLEDQMVKYKDLKKIKVKECGEPLITLSTINNCYQNELNDMESILRKKVWFRQTVVKKLILAQKLLKKIRPSWQFLVTYGYRSYEVQKKYFNQILKKLRLEYQNKNLLYEAIHRQIAIPEVAGHPTGGAVDLTIIDDDDNNKQINMGTKIYDFNNKDIYTFTPFIPLKAKKNRLLLRLVMLKVGFAPFDGEWWHFSFGDKEWVFYYKKSVAIYNKVIKLP